MASGARYLEALVPGTKKPAEDGTLVILAAGDQGLYGEVTPALEKLGKNVHSSARSDKVRA